jgi:two-component system, cell cycle sensor histidine kinase and response regulator CckA
MAMGGITDSIGAESGRIAALYRYGVLDTPEDAAFDRITELAARLFKAPFAAIGFLDRERQWYKSRFGLSITDTPREGSFARYAVLSDEPLVVPDAARDERFNGPVLVGSIKVRFYAGAPLVTPEGFRIGTLAVMDTRPRAGLTEEELVTLTDLAAVVMHELDLEQELAEARLKSGSETEGEAKFRALMESASQAIIAINQRGRIEVVNNKAEELFGYERNEMIGQPLEILLPQRLRDSHVGHRTQYFGHPHPRPMGIGMDLSGRRSDGREFPVEISLNYVEVGGRSLAISFITDISERQRLEGQLRQSQKMEAIGQLAGGVAHDFNNLLTIIQGYSSMSLDGLAPDNPLREPMEEIERAALSAAALTRQLLAFSRRQIVQPRVLNINTVILQVERMLRRVIGEDVELILSTSDDVEAVYGDPGLIEQILMNLAVNARDAMPNGGKLILETANLSLDKEYAGAHLAVKTGPHAMLAVTDTGVGMSEDVRAHIFEPFFTTKPQGQGTGLGLATVYGIVQQMEGSIWVYSELGKGTTFKILFPTAPADAASDDGPPEMREHAQGVERILLVEDESAVRKFVRTMLEKQGYTVVEAADTEEAMRLAADRTIGFDVLLTDVIMPRLNGPELAEQVTKLRPGLPVLYMSGYTDRAIRLQDRLGGEAHFIQKPFTPAGLGQKLRQLLVEK